ncbi:hypothetical protein ZIOFF_037165 [Zingiber officinale]|uniref:CASP-like protein n=1 Tax=Zingiber officinale TaxID=94328 RepID=A0A8J5GJT0_ZINOF|nr:hypothetical protein ZIOFF_037165 [Zingiber officinale]
MDLHGVWELASPIKRAPPPATSGIQCHLLTSTACTTCCATTNQTPTSRPQTPIRSISCSPSAEQSTIMKSTDEEGQQQRTQQGGDVAKAEDAGSGRVAETLLRVAPIGLCLAAMAVMLKNSQDGDFGSISYSDLAAFKYLVYANGACAAYSLLSVFYVAIPRPSIPDIHNPGCRNSVDGDIVFGIQRQRECYMEQIVWLLEYEDDVDPREMQSRVNMKSSEYANRHMLKVSMNKMMKMIEAALEAHGATIVNLTLNKLRTPPSSPIGGYRSVSIRGIGNTPKANKKEATLAKDFYWPLKSVVTNTNSDSNFTD